MLSRLAFWMLFPIAIPQALRLKKTAPRFSGAAGNTFGRTGVGNKCSLLAIGDSLIEGVGAKTLDKALVGQTARAISTKFGVEVAWDAYGKIGANTQYIQRFIVPKIPNKKFDVILISTGVNDVTGLKSSGFYQSNLTALITYLRAHSPTAQIVVAGLPPMNKFPLLPQPLRTLLGIRSRTFDKIIERVASREGAVHVPVEIKFDAKKFAGDGYHPSESGYADFGDAIAALLESVDSDNHKSEGCQRIESIECP